MRGILYTDGGARGNPGPAGIGYVLEFENGREIPHGEYLGEMTNNQAEYRALLAGLKRAKQAGVAELECRLDSELVVRQLTGEYRVRDADLKPLFAEIMSLSATFEKISFAHVPREKNKRADKLVNEALDKNIPA